MAMLWYKAWRESRTAFLICASVLATICIGALLLEPALRRLYGASLRTNEQYVYRVIYSGAARGLFSVFAIVLGLGGLQRERAHNSVGFTLALPVTRPKLVTVRALAGLAELSALALIPAVLLPLISAAMHRGYPLSQALGFSVLWITCGAVIFSAAFLASTVFTGEYTALTVTFVSYFFSTGFAAMPVLNRYPLHINHIMSGYHMPYFDAQRAILIDLVPWTILIALAALTTAFFAVAARITVARDFS